MDKTELDVLDRLYQCLKNIEAGITKMRNEINEQTFQIEKARYYAIYGTMEGFCVGWEDKIWGKT